jgi:hypothetical protein
MSKNKIVIFIILGFVTVLSCLFFIFRFYFFGTSSRAVDAKDNSDFHIANIVSSIDMDQDGIDDQTDILQGARNLYPRIRFTKANIMTRGIPMINMASVRTLWQMPC